MIRRRLFGAGACLLFATVAYASSIRVTLSCRTAVNCDTRGTLLLQSVADKSVIHRVDLDSAAVVVSEQPGSQWEMTLEAKGFWALPQRVVFPAKEGSSTYSMAVWR